MSTYVLSSHNGSKTLYPNHTFNTAEYVKDTYEWSLTEHLKNDEKGNTNQKKRLFCFFLYFLLLFAIIMK